MKLSKELLKEIYEFVDENLKAKIENEVPEIKPIKLKINNWYYWNDIPFNAKVLINITKIENEEIFAYGFVNGEYKDERIFYSKGNYEQALVNLSLATPEEVEMALVNESKRRYNGEKVRCNHILNSSVNFNDYIKIELKTDNCLRLYTDRNCICIMDYNGTWATIITEPTEKELLIERANKVEAELIELKNQINAIKD